MNTFLGRRFVQLFVMNLWTLVDLFFVLSGFIFAHVYLTTDGSLKTGTTASKFAIARLARLYPLHVLTLFAVAALVTIHPDFQGIWAPIPIGGSSYDTYHFVLNLFFLEGSGLERSASFNAPSWSLTAEMLCYILFYVAARFQPSRIKLISVALVSIAVASQVIPGAAHLPTYLARGIVGFFAGVLVQRHKHILSGQNTWLLVGLLCVAGVMAKAAGSISKIDYGIRLSLAFWPLVLILGLRGRAAKVLNLVPFQTLGDLSFSIYLLHLPLLLALIMLHGGSLFSARALMMLTPVFLAILLGISYISFSRFEEPARRWINARGRKKEISPPQAADVF